MESEYKNPLTSVARKLRREMTPEERQLWYECLRDHPVHFYRQRAIGRYIVDFYCAGAALVVELDGAQHYEKDGPEKDRLRTEELQSRGLTVLRFSNLDVRENFYGVCTVIDRFVHEALGERFPQRSVQE